MDDTDQRKEHEAWQIARNHYNLKADQGKCETLEEAVKQRLEGPAKQLKDFHGTIKKELIRRFGFKVDSLLDFCSGRGGDLHKWLSAKIKRVKGVDISEKEVEEAKRRYADMQQRIPDCELVANFEVSDSLGSSDWTDGNQYDVVSCMFALHYFYITEQALKQFLKNVSSNLKEGGYFLGAVPDGKKVLANLQNKRELHLPLLKLTKHWQGGIEVFGCPYTFAIADTVTEEAHVDSTGSYEYLVFFNALTALAARYNLKPVIDYGDPELLKYFDPADSAAPYKHFQPHFPGSDPSLELASALNCAFVFQKVSKEHQEVTLPPIPPRPHGRRPSGIPPQGQQANDRHAGWQRGGNGHHGQQQKRDRPQEPPVHGHNKRRRWDPAPPDSHLPPPPNPHTYDPNPKNEPPQHAQLQQPHHRNPHHTEHPYPPHPQHPLHHAENPYPPHPQHPPHHTELPYPPPPHQHYSAPERQQSGHDVGHAHGRQQPPVPPQQHRDKVDRQDFRRNGGSGSRSPSRRSPRRDSKWREDSRDAKRYRSSERR